MAIQNKALIRNILRSCGSLLILSGLGILSGYVQLPLEPVYAQAANTFYFTPSSTTVAPNASLTLKANVGTNATNFAAASVKIDLTKVRVDTRPGKALSYPLVLNKTLFLAVATDAAHINCSPASDVTGCTDGLIRFALAKCPAAAVTTLTSGLEGCYQISNTAQTGIFDMITIPVTSINDTAKSTSPITFSAVGNEAVKDLTDPPTDLSMTNVPASLDVWIRGDADGAGVVTGSDLFPWRANFGNSVTNGAVSGDFNGDGTVLGSDLFIWRNNFGKGA